jgi:hypothetical protein
MRLSQRGHKPDRCPPSGRLCPRRNLSASEVSRASAGETYAPAVHTRVHAVVRLRGFDPQATPFLADSFPSREAMSESDHPRVEHRATFRGCSHRCASNSYTIRSVIDSTSHPLASSVSHPSAISFMAAAALSFADARAPRALRRAT